MVTLKCIARSVIPYTFSVRQQSKYYLCFHQYLCKQNLFNNTLTRQTRYFASNSYSNKVTLYLQRAKLIDSIRICLCSSAPESLFPVLNDPAVDSFVVTNALRSAPSPDSALSLIETLKRVPHFSHTQNTLYALAKILAKSGQTSKLRSLIDGIDRGKFTNVSRVSFMDRMRWYATAGDLDEVLCIWDEWRALPKRPCTESYNIVISLSSQMHKDLDAVKTFCRMIDEGSLPNCRTYTILIEHLLSLGKVDSAFEVFNILPSMRMKRTLRQYSVLVGAFSESQQFDKIKALLLEMRADGVLPSRAMRSSLQSMNEAGFVEETAELIKEMLPDKRIQKVKSMTHDVSDDDDDDVSDDDDADIDEVKLKPWFDPAALTSALYYWRPEEVSVLEQANFVWTTRLVCKMIRNFSSAETAWQFFCWVLYQPGFAHDVYTVSRMITKLARQGHVDLVDQLASKIKKERIKLSFGTIKLIIDFYGLSGNGEAALKIFESVKTLCESTSKTNMLVLYSSLLRTLTKCKMDNIALDILDEMILCGVLPDIQTFSGLMHHFAVQGDIKTVQRLFGLVKQSGVGPDAYMYKVLIRAYCKCERAVLALRVFEDMRSSNLVLDVLTKQLLVKSLWNEGKLREAAAVEERSQEVNDVLPLALPGHLYTVSSSDLARVKKIYCNSFTSANG